MLYKNFLEAQLANNLKKKLLGFVSTPEIYSFFFQMNGMKDSNFDNLSNKVKVAKIVSGWKIGIYI